MKYNTINEHKLVHVAKFEHTTNIYCLINALNDSVECVGERRTRDDYIVECLHGENECAELVKVYTDIYNKHDIKVWCDTETGETFITL